MKEYKSICPCGSLNEHSDRRYGAVACLTCGTLYKPEAQELIEDKSTSPSIDDVISNPLQLILNVEQTFSSNVQTINLIEQVFNKSDLTHNEERAVAEWVWMAYGRGGDQ